MECCECVVLFLKSRGPYCHYALSLLELYYGGYFWHRSFLPRDGRRRSRRPCCRYALPLLGLCNGCYLGAIFQANAVWRVLLASITGVCSCGGLLICSLAVLSLLDRNPLHYHAWTLHSICGVALFRVLVPPSVRSMAGPLSLLCPPPPRRIRQLVCCLKIG